MAPDFIFMLTHHDRTIADAQDQVPAALSAGVRHIGFKDVGLPLARLRRLADAIRAASATLHLEVVSLDELGAVGGSPRPALPETDLPRSSTGSQRRSHDGQLPRVGSRLVDGGTNLRSYLMNFLSFCGNARCRT
jgi:hypothetical protein